VLVASIESTHLRLGAKTWRRHRTASIVVACGYRFVTTVLCAGWWASWVKLPQPVLMKARHLNYCRRCEG
jgi:hypothetical protein